VCVPAFLCVFLCVHVRVYARACVCIWVCMCAFACVCEMGLGRMLSACAGSCVCVFLCVFVCIHPLTAQTPPQASTHLNPNFYRPFRYTYTLCLQWSKSSLSCADGNGHANCQWARPKATPLPCAATLKLTQQI